MKKLIAITLALSMLILTLASCSDNSENDQTEIDAQAETEAETIPEETLDIEVKNYEGRDFNIVLSGNWDFDDFIAEEMTGESINDAKFETNSAVMQLLNVNIKVNNQSNQASGGTGAGYKIIDNMVMAGTNDYDFAEIGCYDVSTLAYTGKLLDLTKVQNIELSKSWWDQKANEQLAIKGHLYYTTGDAGTLDNGCTYCVLFNKEVIDQYNLDNPYTLVSDNKWLYDKFAEMGNSVYSDLNGNGVQDGEDSFGILMWQDSVIGMLHASGGRFATIEEDGSIDLTLNTERNIDVLTSWLTLRTTPTVGFIGTSNVTIPEKELENAFTDNRALFYCRYVNAVSWFRDMDTDFGILPYPKWDETQQDYCNTMHAYGTSFYCIPKTVYDPAMSGAVIEALSYYGQKNITPAYYEKTLKGKYFRDEDSADMLDLIFESRFFDVGAYYQIGGYNEQVISMMQSQNTDFSSMYQKGEKVANKVLDKINTSFADMFESEG